VRGIATSGWRGRSQSLGIADAVTVLARSAAEADAAATLIASAVNPVNFDHPAIERRPARSLKEDSDLGDLPVTVGVATLPPREVAAALQSGAARAGELQSRGLIYAAYLSLQGEALACPAAVDLKLSASTLGRA
jgi:ApbE superfamily uncharacterized protein (UPF0280 family)